MLGQEPRLGDPFSFSVIIRLLRNPKPHDLGLGGLGLGALVGHWPSLSGGGWKMLIFYGLPARVRQEPKKDARPPEALQAPGGPRRPLKAPGGQGSGSKEGSSVAGPLFMKEEWEFRASAGNPKGIKLGGCLRKQGVGRINQHTSSWFVGHEGAPSHDMPPPTILGVSRRHFYIPPPAAALRDALHPKP